MGSSHRARSIVIAFCLLAAACGGGGGGDERTGETVQPGFFIGKTAQGSDLSIAVGSIRAVFFGCGGTDIAQRFEPPEPVAVDGSFAVDVVGGGFTVSGRIVDQNRIEGTIGSGITPECSGAFTATRCNPATQRCGDADGDGIPDEVDPTTPPGPTPQRTATPAATPPATPPAASPTPAPTATPGSNCGNGVIDGDEECDGADLDDNTCFDLCDQEDEGGTLRCNPDCTYDFSGCPPPRDCAAF